MKGKLAFATALMVSGIISGADSKASSGFKATNEDEKTQIRAPEFTGVTDWMNSKPFKLADLRGKVVVVHFWTNGCINCIHNYPQYRRWTDKYKENKNLVMVG